MMSKINKKLCLSIFITLFVFNLSLSAEVGTSQTSSTAVPVSEIFTKRHSGKSFDPTISIPAAYYETLIEAARWTPSSYNDQPWNFIFVDKHQDPEAYMNVLDSLLGPQREWVENAPLIVIAIARTKDLYKGNFNEWAEYDTGAAVLALSLQAADLGLMTHQIGGFEKEKIIEDFALPENFKPVTVTAVGYELDETEPPQKPRTRRPIIENFFLGKWNEGFDLSLLK